jgi:hypothetical protein
LGKEGEVLKVFKVPKVLKVPGETEVVKVIYVVLAS